MRKDASTVLPDPSGEGKQQHVVEVCNFVDAGTSLLRIARRFIRIFMRRRLSKRWCSSCARMVARNRCPLTTTPGGLVAPAVGTSPRH